jgi:hypothetical protein
MKKKARPDKEIRTQKTRFSVVNCYFANVEELDSYSGGSVRPSWLYVSQGAAKALVDPF